MCLLAFEAEGSAHDLEHCRVKNSLFAGAVTDRAAPGGSRDVVAAGHRATVSSSPITAPRKCCVLAGPPGEAALYAEWIKLNRALGHSFRLEQAR